MRVEYIDALRGFVMFLVVSGHVLLYILHHANNAYDVVLERSRMPLFFFISGLMFFKTGRIWTLKSAGNLLWRKFKVLILFPLLCMIVYAHLIDVTIFYGLGDESKLGYWFTYALFEYFALYILFDTCMQSIKSEILRDILFLVVGLIFYWGIWWLRTENLLFGGGKAAYLGVQKLNYFMYFVLGALAKKHIGMFQRILENKYVMTIVVLCFVLLNCYPELRAMGGVSGRFVLSTVGLIVFFAFFRKYQSLFSSAHLVGRSLQYVGRKTLDIYLLHYFFLYGISYAAFSHITLIESPLAEFLVSSLITIVIIGFSLVVSKLLRLSPLVEEHLLGQKTVRK